jgi:hypothetical protein
MHRSFLPFLLVLLLVACGGEEKKAPTEGGGGTAKDSGGLKTLDRPETATQPDQPAPPPADPLLELTKMANLAFAGGDAETQLEAVDKIFSGKGDKTQRAMLIARALEAEDGDVRSYAAETLGKMEVKTLASNLRALLASEEEDFVRKQAVNSLFRLAGTGAVPDLVKTLSGEDENYTVRAISAQLLGRSGSKLAVRPLMTALEEDFNDSVRREAIVALATLKASEAKDLIIDSLRDANALVRTEAANALGRLEVKEAVEPLITALDPETEFEVQVLEAITKALGKIVGFDKEDMVDFLYDSNATEAQKKAIIENWKEWWQENKAEYK